MIPSNPRHGAGVGAHDSVTANSASRAGILRADALQNRG
jgi:hypothetical protein